MKFIQHYAMYYNIDFEFLINFNSKNSEIWDIYYYNDDSFVAICSKRTYLLNFKNKTHPLSLSKETFEGMIDAISKRKKIQIFI